MQQNHPYSTLSSGKNGSKRLNPNLQSTDSIMTDASQLSMEPTKLKRLDFGSLIADSQNKPELASIEQVQSQQHSSVGQ